MPIVVPESDYGPIFNALRLQGEARQNTVGNLFSAVSDLAKFVFQQQETAALETMKGVLRDFQQETNQRMNDYAAIGEIKPQPDGTVRMPREFEKWYEDSMARIRDDPRFQGFAKVTSWAQDQAYNIYDTAKNESLAVVLKQAIVTRDAGFQKDVNDAIRRDIADPNGNLDNLTAVVGGASWLTKEERALAFSTAKDAILYGRISQGARNIAATQGYEAGLAYVNEKEGTGELTKDQATGLRSDVNVADQQVELVWTNRIMLVNSESRADPTRDPAADVAAELLKVPEHILGKVRDTTDALIAQTVIRDDTAANKAMWTIWEKANFNQAVGMSELLNTKNNFNHLMTTESLLSWQYRFTPKGGEGEAPSEPAVLTEMWRRMKEIPLRTRDEQGIGGPSFAKYLMDAAGPGGGLNDSDFKMFWGMLDERKQSIEDPRYGTLTKRINDAYDIMGRTGNEKQKLENEAQRHNSLVRLQREIAAGNTKNVDELFAMLMGPGPEPLNVDAFTTYGVNYTQAADQTHAQEIGSAIQPNINANATTLREGGLALLAQLFNPDNLTLDKGLPMIEYKSLEGGTNLPVFVIHKNGKDYFTRFGSVETSPGSNKWKLQAQIRAAPEPATATTPALPQRWVPAETFLKTEVRKASAAGVQKAIDVEKTSMLDKIQGIAREMQTRQQPVPGTSGGVTAPQIKRTFTPDEKIALLRKVREAIPAPAGQDALDWADRLNQLVDQAVFSNNAWWSK